MSSILLAVPSANPGGLEAGMGMHFGHCDLYTLVEVEGDAVKSVRTLPSIPHQQGGCLAPVQYLADNGVTKLLAGGMGMRPLMGFQQMGIEVLFAGNFATGAVMYSPIWRATCSTKLKSQEPSARDGVPTVMNANSASRMPSAMSVVKVSRPAS